jgi:hypothetical protein
MCYELCVIGLILLLKTFVVLYLWSMKMTDKFGDEVKDISVDESAVFLLC